MGKTNLLDGIHYLAFTKSAFTATETQHIRHEAPFMAIHGSFQNENKVDVSCYLERGKKKVFKVNRLEPEKLSDHIGSIPLILTTPYDVAIIQEGSEVRRKLVDGTLSQFDHPFLEDLLHYQKVLRQRNALLKNQHNTSSSSLHRLLDVYDEDIVRLSLSISQRRSELIEEFAPLFAANYQTIASGAEQTSIAFVSGVLQNNFEDEFKSLRKKDMLSQRTHLGAHRDDIDFLLGGYSVKKLGSQGQQKSVILALRLAQFDYLSRHTATRPILMMDDIFDKFDDRRINKLLHLLSDESRFQQILLTDARPDTANRLFKEIDDVSFFEINHGKHLK